MKIPRVLGPVAAIALVASVSVALGSARAPAGPVPVARPAPDFTRDIQPILAASCVRCHGPRKTEGELRLDTHAGLLKGGEAGPAVVPGDGEGSRLYHLIIEK